jgi:hypothetical protein
MNTVTFPETPEELRYNRVRFLEELRKEENAARAIQGTIFSRDRYVNGKPKCCAVGVAAELFLGISDWDEYNQQRNDYNVYGVVDRLLGADSAFIDGLNDSINPIEFSFNRVADELERIWEL